MDRGASGSMPKAKIDSGVLMMVAVVMARLVPILWSTGIGSDIMKPIAAPIVGGTITSTIHVLIITPVIL